MEFVGNRRFRPLSSILSFIPLRSIFSLSLWFFAQLALTAAVRTIQSAPMSFALLADGRTDSQSIWLALAGQLDLLCERLSRKTILWS